MRGIESAPAIEIAMSSIAAIFTICSFRSLQLFPLQLFRSLQLNPARRVHLTLRLHRVPRSGIVGGSGLLGGVCSLVLSCCGIAFGMDGAGRVPAGRVSDNVLESSCLILAKNVGVADRAIDKESSYWASARVRTGSGFGRVDNSAFKYLPLRISSERSRVLRGRTPVKPDFHITSGRLPIVLNCERGVGIGKNQILDTNVAPKLPISVSASNPGSPDTSGESPQCDERQNIITIVCSKHLEEICSWEKFIGFLGIIIFGPCIGISFATLGRISALRWMIGGLGIVCGIFCCYLCGNVRSIVNIPYLLGMYR